MNRTTRRAIIIGGGPILAAGATALGLVTLLGGRPAPAPAPLPRPPSAVAAGILPDPRLTPGEVLPGVTAADTCQPGYARRNRDVPESVKVEVFRRYGISLADRGKYEVDHVVPLSLAGSNHISNLHPELWDGPYGAHIKDRAEFLAFRMVCKGELTIRDAQAVFMGDWREFYRAHRQSGPDDGGAFDTEGFPIEPRKD